MKQEPKPYSQHNLFIRLLAGAYLLYTAWNLQDAITEDPRLIIAMVAFGVIGAALIIHAGWKMYKGQYEGAPGAAAGDEPADAEEEKNNLE